MNTLLHARAYVHKNRRIYALFFTHIQTNSDKIGWESALGYPEWIKRSGIQIYAYMQLCSHSFQANMYPFTISHVSWLALSWFPLHSSIMERGCKKDRPSHMCTHVYFNVNFPRCIGTTHILFSSVCWSWRLHTHCAPLLGTHDHTNTKCCPHANTLAQLTHTHTHSGKLSTVNINVLHSMSITSTRSQKCVKKRNPRKNSNILRNQLRALAGSMFSFKTCRYVHKVASPESKRERDWARE